MDWNNVVFTKKSCHDILAFEPSGLPNLKFSTALELVTIKDDWWHSNDCFDFQNVKEDEVFDWEQEGPKNYDWSVLEGYNSELYDSWQRHKCKHSFMVLLHALQEPSYRGKDCARSERCHL